MKKIQELLKKQVVVLDGAMGTELQKQGMQQGVAPEIWCLDNPKILKAVQKEYLDAGAQVLYTATFGANKFKLDQYGSHNVRTLNRKLAQITRNVAGAKALVAGDLGPTGRFIKPFGELEFEEAVDVFKEQVKGLLDAGVDLFVIETMIDIQEARAALIAVKELTDKFVAVTMTYEKNAATLNGTDAVSALITLQSLGADAVGCNCSSGPEQMVSLIEKMKPFAKVFLLAKPNAGMPKLKDGHTYFEMPESKFAEFAKGFVKKGVNLIGGCCGTTPGHIQALSKELKKAKPKLPLRSSLAAVSSARKYVSLEKGVPLVVVGECINPTGKKKLHQELREGKMTTVRFLAKEQQASQAALLDVNAGVAGIDEKSVLTKIIETLSVITPLPLVIDSSNPDVIEKALRIYPGRALVNSLSGDENKLKRIIALIQKYGAMCIILPITGNKVPHTFRERKQVIKKITNFALKLGLTKKDFVIDGLVMTISSNPRAALETIKTVSWCTNVLKCNTIVGLSNISFGMPQREILNSAFLAALLNAGLTMAISNPLEKEGMNLKYATDLLLAKDKNAAAYINFVSNKTDLCLEKDRLSISLEEQIRQTVIEGNRDEITGLLKAAIERKFLAENLVSDILIPAMSYVGDLFDRKEFFLPQLIAAAETMQKGCDYLKPYFKKESSLKQEKKTIIILATVKGDIHDIGKNIVSLILKNHGFEVIDLGKDVSTQAIVNAIKKHQAALVGLSALMTTTMVEMKEVIEQVRRLKIKCRFIVGGAVVNREYAHSIGAEYAADGVDAVRIVKKLLEA